MATDETPRVPVLTHEQRERLWQIMTLLNNVTDPRIALRAKFAGYTSEDHQTGQRLFTIASGTTRSFDDALTRIDVRLSQAKDGSLESRYAAVDAFENLWFPQADSLMQRHLTAEAYEKLGSAFWLDMKQQPLGPAVVGSVGLFLQRLDELEKQSAGGVPAIFAAFSARGLTAEARLKMRETVKAFGELPDPPARDEAALDAVRTADAEQLRAFEELNRWYIDVAGNLRSKLGYHDRIQLGVSEARSGKPAAENPGNPNLNEQ